MATNQYKLSDKQLREQVLRKNQERLLSSQPLNPKRAYLNQRTHGSKNRQSQFVAIKSQDSPAWPHIRRLAAKSQYDLEQQCGQDDKVQGLIAQIRQRQRADKHQQCSKRRSSEHTKPNTLSSFKNSNSDKKSERKRGNLEASRETQNEEGRFSCRCSSVPSYQHEIVIIRSKKNSLKIVNPFPICYTEMI